MVEKGGKFCQSVLRILASLSHSSKRETFWHSRDSLSQKKFAELFSRSMEGLSGASFGSGE